MKVDSSIRSHAWKCLAVLSVAACTFLAMPARGEDARPETDQNARVPIALVVDDEALRQAMSFDRNANDMEDVQDQIDRTLRECENRIATIVRSRLGMNVNVQRVTGLRFFTQMLNTERSRSHRENLSHAQNENKKMEREIEALVKEKAEIEEKLQKSQDEVKELKEDVMTAKDETIAAKEALDKAKETIEKLKELLKKRPAYPRPVAGPATSGARLTPGDKGTILSVSNEKGFAVVKFDDAALDELIGLDRNGALPPREMLVVRPGKNKVIGKIRLRQWTPKTNLVTVDILTDWQQAPFEVGDVVRPN